MATAESRDTSVVDEEVLDVEVDGHYIVEHSGGDEIGGNLATTDQHGFAAALEDRTAARAGDVGELTAAGVLRSRVCA